MAELTVSEVAREAGMSADGVRYYEKLGLLQPVGRSGAGYRLYDNASIERLRFIRSAQRVGLRLREIGELLEVMDRGQCPCGHTDALLRRRIEELDQELAQLTALRAALVQLVTDHPEGSCPDETGDWWCRAEFR
jgi:DNA-binding transcriptional MerR regulator